MGWIFQGRCHQAGLASYLANLAGSPVQDLTGLTELYDFSLDLTPPPGAQPELQEGNVPLVDQSFCQGFDSR